MELRLPDLGEGVMEGEIARWLVKPGDDVKDDQIVVEVMTDKATVEIPTNIAGKVGEILAKEGATVKVGQALMSYAGTTATHTEKPIAKPNSATPAAQSTATTKMVSTPLPPMSARSGNGADAQAAPAVRKLAREMGIEISAISGSGPHGRILMDDVQKAKGNFSYSIQAPTSQTYSPTSQTNPTGKEEHVPLRGLRKKISEKMALSKHTAAHFTYVDECDVTELVELRKAAKVQAETKGVKITFMPFITKACAIAIKEFPMLNASLIEDGKGSGEIVYKKYYNFGMAVDTEDGLTVPVIKDVDKKSIFELASDMQNLSQKARDKKLSPQDFHDGTFTITNAGNIGGLFATPIINYPEVAILGVHQIKKRPLVINDEIKIRDVLWLSLSLDHRVVDGADGARFMNRLISLLANPKIFLLELR